ncbi:peptide chain release factor N(5)-glutamine methyltransferase [Bradyrhizobium sp. SYSU BS000235]|uniref:peptide chain release factor N(5)-glutamine methyltransferase n=1 Tax=Bradyrhizobium sp. SYSU BS000235 TaxID=3411332 RepID=UPI003C714240
MTAAKLAGLSVDVARRTLAARLKESGIDSPELDARLLIGAALDLDHTGLAVHGARQIIPVEAGVIESFAKRRIEHEPIARILGHKEFWGLDLRLSKATLVPRPDTETVVEAALEFVRSNPIFEGEIRIADIGTGSGAILLALLSELHQAIGTGTDISCEAIATAELNAERLGIAHRASFIQCNYAAGLSGFFDLIVSNPPYIRSLDIQTLDAEVRDNDPHLALDGGPDGFDAYRIIVPQAAKLLAPGGGLIVEVGYDQSRQVSQMMQAAGLTVPHPPRADLGGIERVVVGQQVGL